MRSPEYYAGLAERECNAYESMLNQNPPRAKERLEKANVFANMAIMSFMYEAKMNGH